MATEATETRVALPRGLYGHDRVDVAYEPWRAIRPTALRIGPSPNAPIVPTDDGRPVQLAEGQHLGRQSTRNPRALDAPPLRPPVSGYVWGYAMSPVSHKSGWMALDDLELDPEFEDRACGPAGADFDRRDPDSCGGHGDGRPLSGIRAASGAAAIAAQDVYVRYAPQSTAFRYLVRGDQVRRLVRHSGYVGIEVRTARWSPRGGRGWVIASAVT
jgi:hypothetical protein